MNQKPARLERAAYRKESFMKIFRERQRVAIARSMVLVVALLVIPANAALAQTQETQKQTPEVQQLKERLRQLEETVEQMKAQLETIENTPKPSEAIGEKISATATTSAAKPQDDEKKGESSFEVYGFVMLDAGYQFKQADPNWFDTVRPVKLPAFKDQFAPNGNAYFSVRQSRFGVK